VACYVRLIHEAPLANAGKHFIAYLRAIGELWWRFVHRFQAPRWLWFRVLRDGEESWSAVRAVVDALCPQCLDVAFSVEIARLSADTAQRARATEILRQHALLVCLTNEPVENDIGSVGVSRCCLAPRKALPGLGATCVIIVVRALAHSNSITPRPRPVAQP
jgi:hypothetical protein